MKSIKNIIKPEHKNILAIISLALLVFTYIVLGIVGISLFSGFFLISVPFYIALGNFISDEGEKIAFSFALGIMIFPSIVYYFGFILSFRLSIGLAFLALFALAYFSGAFFKAKAGAQN